MMINKTFFKILLLSLLSFLLIFTAFYFWAGGSSLDEEAYLRIKQYPNIPVMESDTIKVMTYNIGYLSGMTNNLAVDRSYNLIHDNLISSRAFLSQQKPDIIGFQEIDFDADRSHNFNQLDSLAIVPNYRYGASAVNWDKSYVPFPYWPIKFHFGKVVSGQAILSKMKVLKNSAKVLIKPKSAPFYYNKFYLDRLVQVVFVEVSSQDTLVVLNTHLEAFDRETREIQVKTVVTMYQEYSAKYPVILLGDFNSKPPFSNDPADRDNTLRSLYQLAGIKEAITEKEYLENEDRFYTFDTSKPFERLDYIFYSGDRINKIAAGIAHQAGEISDHLPVWMTFTLKK